MLRHITGYVSEFTHIYIFDVLVFDVISLSPRYDMRLTTAGIRSERPQNDGNSWGLQIDLQGQAGESLDRGRRIIDAARFV